VQYAVGAPTDHRRNEGFRVAVGDVGSGCSSLNLIHRPRPDSTKLGTELARGAERDPYEAEIARRVAELAQDPGTGTAAEGVETPQEMDWARARGAPFAQGWLVAKSRPPPWATAAPSWVPRPPGPGQEAQANPRRRAPRTTLVRRGDGADFATSGAPLRGSRSAYPAKKSAGWLCFVI
jgi:EAL domain-containing protein (putative c-di-GMP-specific phosphodiesterase class I)